MSEIQLPQHKIDKLLEICDAHGNQPGELINVLHKAQHLSGRSTTDCCRQAEYSGI